MTRLYFVRHGESESNTENRFTGQLNIPLSKKGREQAERTADYLQDVPLTAVYASDLSRAFETGQAIAKRHGLTAVPTPHLREIDGGLWHGQRYADLLRLFPDSYSIWKHRLGLAVAPEGESVAHLRERVRAYVEAVVRAHPDEHVCIATHATPIRAMESLWTDTPLENMHTIPWVGNASVTVVDYDEHLKAHIVERDHYQHLADLHTELPKTV
ncbi:MAG: histidine phosphatase family protein [Clostridia bacterium]|nr:histidine phosphatase family protein [Clostridia bacterium]